VFTCDLELALELWVDRHLGNSPEIGEKVSRI